MSHGSPNGAGPRVLAVAPVDQPGGAEHGLLRLLDRLAARGWRPTLASPGPGELRDAAARRGWGWRRLDQGGLPTGTGARALAWWPRARQLAAGHDVVYLNGTVSGRLLPALAGMGTRRVLHVHDMVDRVPPFWRLADVVLADSQAVADRLPGLEAHVVYCPVELDPPRVQPPWPPGPGPVVGFVGRIEPRKGPLDLVHAAPAIRAGAPTARIVLVGSDPYELDPNYVERVLSTPHVEHYPWHPQAAGLMRHLDVLVAPSYREPFGTVLSEAMAVGTPVVATDVDGLPEVVTDGVDGALVPPGRPDALAAAVLDVLRRRDELSPAAARSARRFDADAYAERVEALIAP